MLAWSTVSGCRTCIFSVLLHLIGILYWRYKIEVFLFFFIYWCVCVCVCVISLLNLSTNICMEFSRNALINCLVILYSPSVAAQVKNLLSILVLVLHEAETPLLPLQPELAAAAAATNHVLHQSIHYFWQVIPLIARCENKGFSVADLLAILFRNLCCCESILFN